MVRDSPPLTTHRPHNPAASRKIFDDGKILASFSPAIRDEVLLNNAQELTRRVPLLRENPEFAERVAPCIDLNRCHHSV